MQWKGHVARLWAKRNAESIWVEVPKGKWPREDLGMDSKKIFKWILKK
jgi:hypothetical protein